MNTILIIIAAGLFFIAFVIYIGFGALFKYVEILEEEMKSNRDNSSQVKIGRKMLILYSHHEEVERFPVDKRLDYISAHTPRNEDEDLLAVSVGGKTYYGDEVEFI